MADLPVYTGFWIDHTRGGGLGATLTLKASHGTYIVAAAAIVIQIVGTAIWALAAFAFYQYRTRSKPFRSGFAAQSQIIIRNEGDPFMASVELVKLGYAWRGHAVHAFPRGLALAVFPFCLYFGLIAAGVLVGNIAVNAYDSSHVLIQPLECGNVQSNAQQDSYLGFANLYVNASIVANSYARNCYEGVENAAIACNFYAKQSLPYTVSRNASCPLSDSSLCAGPVIEFVTSPLDSHEDFGINAPPQDRITMQKFGVCAPLSSAFLNSKTRLLETRLKIDNDTQYIREYQLGYYGSANVFGGINSSFAYPEIQYGLGELGYQTSASVSIQPHGPDSGNAWTVPPEFEDIDGDISLIYLAQNAILYQDPVDDPFFLAQNLTATPLGNNQSYYQGSHYANAMLCVDSYEICNPNNGHCTPRQGAIAGLTSVEAFNQLVADLDLNPAQNATFNRQGALGTVTNFYQSVNNVPNAIQATERLSVAPISLGLPANQWELETEGWFQTSLATIQDFSIEFAHKFTAYQGAVEIVPPDSPELTAQCYNQRISTPAYYQNYSFAGIMIVACLGVFLTILALTIRVIVFSLPDRQMGQPKFHKRYAYERDDTISLYRRANSLSDADHERWKPVRNDTGDTQGSQGSDADMERLEVNNTTYKGASEKTMSGHDAAASEIDVKKPMLPDMS